VPNTLLCGYTGDYFAYFPTVRDAVAGGYGGTAASFVGLGAGGRLALADIVSERQLTEAIACNAELWASCIGGATPIDSYLAAIEEAGLKVMNVHDNTAYEFLSKSAQGATRTYGIKSISLLAVAPS